MIGLSFAIATAVLFAYINIRKLKPSSNYVGDEGGLKKRAKEVVYYKCLNIFTSIIYPIASGIIIVLNIITENVDNIFKNILLSFLLGCAISISTIIISRIYTKIKINWDIKNDNLKKYIGEFWLDTTEN